MSDDRARSNPFAALAEKAGTQGRAAGEVVRVPAAVVDELAKTTGFVSREPRAAQKARQPKSVEPVSQINLRAKRSVIQRFKLVAARRDVSHLELFESMVASLPDKP